MQLIIDIDDADEALFPYYAKIVDIDLSKVNPADQLNTLADAFKANLRAQAVVLAAKDAANTALQDTLTQYSKGES